MNAPVKNPIRLRALLASLLSLLLVAGGLTLGSLSASAATGDVASATLNWGVKASFRNYLLSPVAHGSWTVAGNVTADTPFSWTGGTGTANQSGNSGTVGYNGSIHFVGHDGQLDLTISNLRVAQSSATAAQLIVDTYSNSLADPATFVTSTNVAFADVNLAGGTSTSTATTVGFAGAPATLTTDGATAFAGFYTAGTALDPVTFAWPVEQAPVAPTPVVTVSKTTELSPAGEIVTVTGTGFGAWGTATNATRPPLSGTFGGAYVTFGRFADIWEPSKGAASSTRKNGSTAWVVNPANLATIGGAPAGGVAINADGSFTVQLLVSKGFTGEPATGNYGIYTYGGGSSNYAPFETYTPITFSTAPVVAVSKTQNIGQDGETVTVKGFNFAPVGTATNAARPPLSGKFGGAYVTFGKYPDVWKPSAGVSSSLRKNGATAWVVNPEDLATIGGTAAGGVAINADGTFTATLFVKQGYSGEPATGNYGIYTYGGGSSNYAPFETYTPVTFAPYVTVSKTSGLSPAGETVTVTGKNFGANGTATNATRPPLAGKFGGAYVAFGKYADAWKPSAGFTSASRKNGSVAWVLNAEDVATVGGAPAGAVAVNADGSFSVVLTASQGFSGEPATGNYGIYTYGGGSSNYAAFETYTPVTFSGPTGTTTTLTATPDTELIEDGTTTLSAQVTPAAAGTVSFANESTTIGTVSVDASGLATLPVTHLPAGTLNFTATFTPSAPLMFSGSTASLTLEVANKVVGGGSLTWGVKQAFRTYVTGTIAKGSISTTGAGSSGGSFVFGQADGSTFNPATGLGKAPYSGAVRFYGHAGLLDLTFSNPTVTVTSASSATLYLRVNGGSSIAFATLNLAASTKSTPNNTVAYSGAPATLTAAGARAFAGFYAAGESLDSVSFVIGTPKTVGAGTRTVASAASNVAAATPPAATGVTSEAAEFDEGGEYTFEASGFGANESGILAVIYSEPTILAKDVKADADGSVSWTGHLPNGLTGEHTFTFQGSVDRGIVLTINPIVETAALEGCDVTDGVLTWGFKESFRSYVSGTIANGEWTTANGATYETPDFGWSNGEGVYDVESGEGKVGFVGSITFTGHGGILNTTVANPQIRFDDENTAYVILDISGTTQEGETVDAAGVEFVRLDLSAATVETAEDGTVTITGAPAELTADGAAAFGTYESGEEFDPVTVSFVQSEECAVTTIEPTQTPTDVAEPTSSTTDLSWLIWLIAALLVIAAVVTIVIVRRRAKASAEV